MTARITKCWGWGLLALAAALLAAAVGARADIIKSSTMGALGGGGGTLIVQDGDAILLGALLIGTGGTYDTVIVEGGLLSVSGTLELATGGLLDVNGGTLRAGTFDRQDGTFDFTGGLLQTYRVRGDLISDGGTLRTWTSLGIDTRIEGDLDVRDGAISLVLVNTYPQGFRQWRWNKVLVAGDVALAGTLDVSMVVTTPSMIFEGLVFDLMDWGGALTGTFDDVKLPDLPRGLAWNTDDLYTTGELRIVPEPAAIPLIAAGAAFLLARRRR